MEGELVKEKYDFYCMIVQPHDDKLPAGCGYKC